MKEKNQLTKKNNHRKKGFSLVECVVAIAVITLVTSVAVGVYTSAQGSSSHQWGNYLATVMADDAVACFKNAEDLDQFEARSADLEELRKCGDRIVVGTDGDSAEDTVSYQTIRAHEDGRVEFYTQTPTGTPFATFTYDDLNKYKADVHDRDNSLDKGGVFKGQKEPTKPTEFRLGNDLSGKTAAQILENVANEDKRNAVSIRYFQENGQWKQEIILGYEKYGGTTSSKTKETTGTLPLSDLENYLLTEKNWILGFPDNAPNKSSIANTVGPDVLEEKANGYSTNFYNDYYLYLYVYDISGSKPTLVTRESDGARLVIRITCHHEGNWSNGAYGDGIWDKNDSVKINDIRSAYVAPTVKNNSSSVSYQPYCKDDGTDFAHETAWKGLPAFLHYCVTRENAAHVTPNYNDANFPFAPIGGGQSSYTDYTLADGKSAELLKVADALSKSGSTQLRAADSAETPTVLFEYTDNKRDEALSGFGFEEDTGFSPINEYRRYCIVTVAPTEAYGTQYYTYLTEKGTDGCLIKVTYSNTVNGERRIDAWFLPKAEIDAVRSGAKTAEAATAGKECYATFTKG